MNTKMKRGGIALALLLGMAIGASASGNVRKVTANLDYGVTIKLDGKTQTMSDAKGVRVYPLVYNGTTYLPVRAVAGMVNLPVTWDEANQTVLLGKQGGVDLINTFKPYTPYKTDSERAIFMNPVIFVQSKDEKTADIGGERVNHWLTLQTWDMGGDQDVTPTCSFNIGGKYQTLTCKVYSTLDTTLTVQGDQNNELAKIPVKGGNTPQKITIDLRNTTQLTFIRAKGEFNKGDLKTFIFDATVE